MVRVGMGNPPFLLSQLDAAVELFRHPNLFEFLQLPVQSGSNPVLKRMVRGVRPVSESRHSSAPSVLVCQSLSCKDCGLVELRSDENTPRKTFAEWSTPF